LLLCAVAAPAEAQFEPLINPLVRTTIPQIIQCPGCNKAQKQTDQPPVRTSEDEGSVLLFAIDTTSRAAMVARFAPSVQSEVPDSPLVSFLSVGNPLAGIDRRMAAFGLSPTNLGDVMAMFIASQWSYSRGSAELPSRDVVQAVKSQFGATMAAQPAVARMSDADKQQVADSAMILTAILAKTIEDAAGNQQTVEEVASVATETLIDLGFDPQKITLTAEGIVTIAP
jgi:hypothetical protein